MNLKLALIGAVLAVGLGWYLVGTEDDNWPLVNDHPTGDVIVAFGDSLTSGQGASQGETYPDHLARLLGGEVINQGVNGDTTGDALRRIHRVLAQKPSVVIITLGGNDILRRLPREETLENLREIFQKLQQRGAMVVYGSVDPPLIGGGWSEVIRDLCRQEGVLYVPNIMEGLWSDSQKMSDQIHPNGTGYRILAERIHERLSEHYR